MGSSFTKHILNKNTMPKTMPKKTEHPSYKDMIKEAITVLKERNGSSRQAIKKYVQANYKLTSSTFDSQFNLALRRAVEKGEFIQPKGPAGPVKVAKQQPIKKEVVIKSSPKVKKSAKPVTKASKTTTKSVKKSAPKKESKAAPKKEAAKKAAPKKSAAKKVAPKKEVAKKAVSKKAAPKKAVKAAPKKAVKAAPKKSTKAKPSAATAAKGTRKSRR